MFRPPLGRSGDTRFSRHAYRNRRALSLLLICVSGVALAACGSSGGRQDATEPAGKFPVQIVKADFANRQRLAQTSDLVLGVKNIGSETIPDLTITISTDPNADAPFAVRSSQQDLANPSRPVWILSNGYPKLSGETAPANSATATTKSYAFGPLEAGATQAMIWRLSPVVPGTYTVNYKIAAGQTGKAVAVNQDGSPPEGEFVVKISDTPPQTRVDDAGNVVPINPNDIVGQAGSAEQRSEVGGGGK